MDWKAQILEWLGELREQARVQAARPNGSRYKLSALDKAIDSISTNAETVADPKELTKLPRVGDKTVNQLSARIKKYCAQNNVDLPPSLRPTDNLSGEAPPAKRVLSTALEGQSYPFAPPPPPQKKKKRDYIPKYGSAAYHVLTTMLLNELQDAASQQGIGQSELQRLMKPRVQNVLEGAVSRSTPAVGLALRTLCEHDCVYSKNSRYFLDDVGRDLGVRLLKASGEWDENLASCRVESPEAVTMAEDYTVDQWLPGDFKTKLLVDNREVASKNDRAGLVNDLRGLGLDLDVQTLTLGDCVWVAEHRSGRRAVLDWIVERKTLADLRSSIHDGRYHDQKKRLAKSTLTNIVYLVEFPNNIANNEMFKDNRRKFMTAMSQTLVKPNFHLKVTKSQNETVQYLARMTRLIDKIYTSQPLSVIVPKIDQFEESMGRARNDFPGRFLGIDYSAFHEGLTKSKLRTIGETFRLMLRTIKGVSAEKAMAIQRIYPTPAHLRRAYLAETSESARKNMIFHATRDCVKRQQIRAALSESICDVWAP